MDAIMAAYQNRYGEIAETISAEMGAPMALSTNAQAATGMGHLATFAVFWPNISLKKCAARPRFAKTGRCMRSDYAVELADQSDCLQSGTGAGCRLHNGA